MGRGRGKVALVHDVVADRRRPEPGPSLVRGTRRLQRTTRDHHAPDDPFLASKRPYGESNGQIPRRVIIP